MVDLSDKKSCDIEGVSSTENQGSEIKKCADCGTSKTPLWRGGPAGPKSLCNACGIRSRKKRRAILGLKSEDKKSKKSNNNNNNSNNTSSSSSSSTTSNRSSGTTLHQRLMAIGREVMMQRSTVDKLPRQKLGEEEQAAVLLMALSYGSVYA